MKYYNDLKITFNIENVFSDEPRIFNLCIIGDSWTLLVTLNDYLLTYPAPKINAVLDMIYRSQDAPKAFGIIKMCLDYLTTLYNNDDKDSKKALKKLKSDYRAVEKYEAYYHLFTEGG